LPPLQNKWYRAMNKQVTVESIKDKLNPNKIPKHIAVIMDGNGRWAQEKGEHRIFGHQNAVTAVTDTVEACAEIGVKFLTLYAFSTENWNRPKEEVDALMELLISTINKEYETLKKNNIRLEAIGDLKSLPQKCQMELQNCIDKTADSNRMTLILALSYSSRWEITHAIKKMVRDAQAGSLNADDVNDDLIKKYLNTKNYPDPELLIRTSGEHRISNFLLWQIAYAELKFFDKFWPDFRKEDLYEAVYEYQNRERRFGKTSEQISDNSTC
jgi:undecaprenyl diphosphate synthase